MSDLADLFPGYASHWIDTSAGKMFARSGGDGPPLLLIHGYAQTNVMWHQVAPALAKHFTLVLPDLPGYGWSVRAEIRRLPRALRQALDGECDDRDHGEARSCPLPSRRP